MTRHILTAQGIAVRRGGLRLLEHADLALEGGGALVLTGPNGCGKTSLLRVLAGLAQPATGRVSRHGDAAYVPERAALTSPLRAQEWLVRVRALRRLPACDWAAAAASAGLDPGVLASPAGTLSNGTRQRVVLLEALAARPRLLLLDEPFAGLDSAATEWLLGGLAAARAAGGAVVVTDHTRAAAGLPGAERRAFRDGGLAPVRA